MMFWYGGGLAFWQVVLMWVVMIGFWGLLVWAIYTLITSVSRKVPGGHGGERGGSARQILDERLARGDIDAEEYRRLRAEIESASHRPGGAAPAH